MRIKKYELFFFIIKFLIGLLLQFCVNYSNDERLSTFFYLKLLL